MAMNGEEKVTLALFLESIKFEGTMAELYKRFMDRYPEDREFWLGLHVEEDYHKLILSHMMYAWKNWQISFRSYLADDIDSITYANNLVQKRLAVMTEDKNDKLSLYRFALEMERTCGESRLQECVDEHAQSELVNIIVKVLKDCNGHADRIEALLAKYNSQ